MHPCCAAWDRACVDPDGGVYQADFFGPRLGTVADAPLAAPWNGPLARAERERHEAVRRCVRARPSCV